jgi:hypothetical protein
MRRTVGGPWWKTGDNPLPEKGLHAGNTATSLLPIEAKGSEKLQGGKKSFLNQDLGLMTISESTASSDRESSPRSSGCRARGLYLLLPCSSVEWFVWGLQKETNTPLWLFPHPNLGFCIPCSCLSPALGKTLLSAWSPAWSGVQLKGNSSEVKYWPEPPSTLCSCQELGRANSSQPLGAKSYSPEEFWRCAYLQRCLNLNQEMSPTPGVQGLAYSSVQALCEQINSGGWTVAAKEGSWKCGLRQGGPVGDTDTEESPGHSSMRHTHSSKCSSLQMARRWWFIFVK